MSASSFSALRSSSPTRFARRSVGSAWRLTRPLASSRSIRTAERDLADVHDLRELGLHHALPVVPREIREHPPLRSRDTHGAQRLVHDGPAQPGHVMDQETDPESDALPLATGIDSAFASKEWHRVLVILKRAYFALHTQRTPIAPGALCAKARRRSGCAGSAEQSTTRIVCFSTNRRIRYASLPESATHRGHRGLRATPRRSRYLADRVRRFMREEVYPAEEAYYESRIARRPTAGRGSRSFASSGPGRRRRGSGFSVAEGSRRARLVAARLRAARRGR